LGCRSLGVWREWWEKRGRRERFREWMMEERRVRREKCSVVGILRRVDENGLVRKRVRFIDVGVDGGILGGREGKLDGSAEQRIKFRKEEFMIKGVECEEIVDVVLGLSGL
jgi:hypothetical protein